MSTVKAKLESLGIILPAPIKLPPDMVLPFSWVRVRGNRAYVSGHIALAEDGSPAPPFGKIGAGLSVDQGYEAARLTGIAMFASLERELGDLERVTAWLRLFGMVNTAPDFDRFPLVINGCSDLVLDVFGTERGNHSRSAVGLAGLPFGAPVEIEGEVEIAP